MKVQSSPSFPAQFYIVTPMSFLALVCFGMLTILVKLRWLFFPVLLFLIAKRLHYGWATAIVATTFYQWSLLPIAMNAAAMTTHYFAPPFWDGPMAHSSLTKPRPFRFVVSNLILLGAVVTLAAGAVAGLFHPEMSVSRGFIAVFVMSGIQVIVSVVLLTFDGSLRTQCRIVVCRRFQEEVSRFSRAGLMPALSAMGAVSTLIDDSIENESTAPADPQGAPVFPDFEIKMVSVRGEEGESWKAAVKQEMSKADLVVVDVTNLSQAIAWELAEAVRSRGPRQVILVGTIKYLFSDEGRRVKDNLRQELMKILGETAAEQTMKAVALPLPYSDDLSNVIFAWRICRWNPHTSPEVDMSPRS